MSFTHQEVQIHNSIDDLWIIIENKVYDLTEFITLHPGGQNIILQKAGIDATILFYQMGHSQYARNIMNRYCIGSIDSNYTEKTFSISEIRSYLDKKQQKMIKNKRPFIIKALSLIFYVILYGIIIEKRFNEFILGYFLAQLYFLILHYFTHIEFIKAGNMIKHEALRYYFFKSGCGGINVAYSHHYSHPHFMPKYSLVHHYVVMKQVFELSFYLELFIIYFIPYFLVKNIKDITNSPFYLMISWFFHMFIQEPGHDYFHTPYYLRKTFFKGRMLYPEYFLLKLYESLYLLKRNNHKLHHNQTYKELYNASHFDDYSMFHIVSNVVTRYFQGREKINFTYICFGLFIFVFVIYLTNIHIIFSILLLITNIVEQIYKIHKYDDSPNITFHENQLELINITNDGIYFHLICKYNTLPNIPILGHTLFTFKNNDALILNNKDNHEMLDLIQRAYSPTLIDEKNKLIEFKIKIYPKNETYPDGGKSTSYLETIQVGNKIEIWTPNTYDFYIEDYCLIKNTIPKQIFHLHYINIICAGSGITPFIRLLAEFSSQTHVYIKFLYFTNNDNDHFTQLLDNTDFWGNNINLNIMNNIHINTKIINTFLFGKELNPVTFICGPQGLLKSAYDLFINHLNYNKNYVVRI